MNATAERPAIKPESCDRCGPTVRASFYSPEYGLTFCGHCADKQTIVLMLLPLED